MLTGLHYPTKRKGVHYLWALVSNLPRQYFAFESLISWAIINCSTAILHFCWVAGSLQEVPANLTAKLINLQKHHASVGNILKMITGGTCQTSYILPAPATRAPMTANTKSSGAVICLRCHGLLSPPAQEQQIHKLSGLLRSLNKPKKKTTKATQNVHV